MDNWPTIEQLLDRIRFLEVENTQLKSQLQYNSLNSPINNSSLTQLQSDLLLFLINHFSDFIYFKDTEGRFLLCNYSVASSHGLTVPEEMYGKTDFDYYPYKMANRFFEEEQMIINTRVPLKSRVEHLFDNNNKLRWISTTKQPILNSQGEVIGILGIGFDITNIKQANDRINRLNEFLLNAQRLGKFASWEYDVMNHQLTVSPFFYELLEIDDQKKIENIDELFMYFDCESQDSWKNTFDKSLLSGENFTLDLQRQSKQGIIYYFLTCQLSKNEAGLIVQITSIIQDITTQKSAELILKEAKEKAEESDKLKTAFLANMSHEIRTPLNAIVGFTNIMFESELDDSEKEEYRSIIEKNSELLLNLIEDILDLSKIQANQISILKRDTNIPQLFDELEFMTRKQNLEKNIQLIVEYPSDKPSVVSLDGNRLRQVLLNLINNAFKYTDQGEIKIGCNFLENELMFYVSDTGVGIPKIEGDSIFERFYKIENLSTHFRRGSGLGLSICKSLIELMGGKIWYESEYLKGTTFYFSIPYETSEKIIFTTTPPKIISTLSTFEGKKVLIAEDDNSNFILLDKLLKQYGILTARANNGSEAYEMAVNGTFDLILMDINMPLMNGLEATVQIKKTGINIPIVAQTAFATSDELEKIWKVKVDDIITKPIKFSELEAVLYKWF